MSEGRLSKTQSVHIYEDFLTAAAKISVDLEDAAFAGLDVSGGYKPAEEVGDALAKKALISAGSAAMGMIPGGGAAATAKDVVLQVGVAMAKTAATTLANNAVNSFDFTTGTMDWNNMGKSTFSAGTLAGILSSGVTAGVGGGIGAKLGGMGETGAGIQKFYGGAINLATAAAGKMTEYTTYTAVNLLQGKGLDSFKQGFDDMGGLTLNVANLGSMIDMLGSTIARNNSTAQSALGSLAKTLGSTGLFEINIGSSGVTGKIGMGGIDVGGALYDLGKRGIDKAALERYIAKNEKAGGIAYDLYVYGDWTQENTAMRVSSGLDRIDWVNEIIGADGMAVDAMARTTGNGKGRTIQMIDGGHSDINVIQLGHEAYRDGIEGNNDKAETQRATQAHTELALRMLQSNNDTRLNENILGDVMAYLGANGDMSKFNDYVDANYDSSGDYWRLTKDGKLKFDGQATVYDDETGKVLISLKDLGEGVNGNDDYTGALAKMFGIDRDKASAIIDNMGDGYKNPIQLGNNSVEYGRTALSKNDYVNALKYTLTDLGKDMVDTMSNSVFNNMTTGEQLHYLQRQVVIGSALFGDDTGAMAAQLRALSGLHANEIKGFYMDLNESILGKLFNSAENFMDGNLRDFLNLNEHGTTDYDYEAIRRRLFREWLDNPGKDYHLDKKYTDMFIEGFTVQIFDEATGKQSTQYIEGFIFTDRSKIQKYTNKDGREVVFGQNKDTDKWEVVTSNQYRGTYNYGGAFDFISGTVHNSFDMDPYLKKFKLGKYKD